ncbi:uncharacterized protein LOC142349424 [Convolutriloba macropyga]|uniref:uncharacterized protein LOC142349424 n=1 Tax=Convolutriloba macropyga TaxID=536237 RepID=UPI003F51D162
MVQINIWFVPRSRSTALMRCLSNIPDSKVFFENFIWAYLLGDKDSMHTERPEDLGVVKNIATVPGVNTNSIIQQWTENQAKVKILKDLFFALKGRHEEVIEKDSVNIFLVRDPEYVFTSFLPTANKLYYYPVKSVFPDLRVFYECILDGIEAVTKLSSKQPLIIDGTQLSSKDGSAKVVKAICEKAGIEFTESLLTWKPTEFLDPTWTAPATLEASDVEQGFFARVNTTTSFADSKERVVDLEELAKEHPDMIEDIRLCKPIYQKIISMPYMLKLD